jgi:hypothetical protein
MHNGIIMTLETGNTISCTINIITILIVDIQITSVNDEARVKLDIVESH